MKAFLKIWIVVWFLILVWFKLETGLSMVSLAVKATILLFMLYRIALFFGRGKKPYRRNNFRV